MSSNSDTCRCRFVLWRLTVSGSWIYMHTCNTDFCANKEEVRCPIWHTCDVIVQRDHKQRLFLHGGRLMTAVLITKASLSFSFVQQASLPCTYSQPGKWAAQTQWWWIVRKQNPNEELWELWICKIVRGCVHHWFYVTRTKLQTRLFPTRVTLQINSSKSSKSQSWANQSVTWMRLGW